MRRRTVIIATIVVAILVAAGAYHYYIVTIAPPVWEVMPKTPMDTFVIAYPDEPITMDPAVAFDWGSLRVIRAMYERLTDYKGESIEEFVPVLAERWEFLEEGTILRMYLRRGIKFHCGNEFDAKAVKFSMDRLLRMAKGPSYIFEPVIDETKVIDKYIVEFTLKYPAPDMLQRFSGQWGFYVVCPHCVEKHATAEDPFAEKWMHTNACGTGPYKLVEWKHGEYQKLAKFDDYWRGWEKPHVKDLFFRWVKEPSTAYLLLKKGEIDATTMLTPEMFGELLDKPISGIKVFQKPSMLTLYIFMANQKPPLDNIYLRKAISYAYDYDALVAALVGLATQLRGVLPSIQWGHDPELPMYTRNLEKAREYMKLAGYPEGRITLKVYYVIGDETERKACEILAASLAEIGITVEVVAVSWPTLAEKFTAGPLETVDMYAFYWTPDWPHPWDWFYFMFHGEQWPTRLGYYNGMYYDNPEVNKLIDELKTELNMTRSIELSWKIQRLIVEDAPCLFLIEIPYLVAMGEWIKGYQYNPIYVYTYNYYDLYKEIAP